MCPGIDAFTLQVDVVSSRESDSNTVNALLYNISPLLFSNYDEINAPKASIRAGSPQCASPLARRLYD